MISRTDKIILWLTQFEFLTNRKLNTIINDCDDIEELFDNLQNYRAEMLNIVTAEEYHEMLKTRSLVDIDRLLENYDKQGIEIVTIVSNDYPELLKETGAAPIVLYCKGDISLLKSECLAVVGSRRSTKYGRDMCTKIVHDVASEGIVIVSGLAEGIDACAHMATCYVKGKTIAVLGGGFMNIYPASNIGLASEIVTNGGLLVSEYKPSEQSLTFHFPIRNRIIAGLSRAVFVVEATEKSGSMHTKNYAIDYGRDVFALPARINDIYSSGCNLAIRNGQAEMLLSSKDIIDRYGKSKEVKNTSNILQLTMEEQLIYDALLGEEKHFDTIIKEVGLDTRTTQTWLTRLVLKGVVEKYPNNYYALVSPKSE